MGVYDYEIKRELEKSRELQEQLVKQQAELIKIFAAVAADIAEIRNELAPKTLDKKSTPLSGNKS